MTITAVAVALSDGPFHVYSPVSIDTGDAKGAALTATGARTRSAIVQIVAAADWYWSHADSVAAADMSLVPAGVPLKIKIAGTINIFAKTASTTKLIVSTLVNE